MLSSGIQQQPRDEEANLANVNTQKGQKQPYFQDPMIKQQHPDHVQSYQREMIAPIPPDFDQSQYPFNSGMMSVPPPPLTQPNYEYTLNFSNPMIPQPETVKFDPVPAMGYNQPQQIQQGANNDFKIECPMGPALESNKEATITESAWNWTVSTSHKILQGVDFVGGKLADFFGITSPRYQYYIEQYEREKKKMDEEKIYGQNDFNRQYMELESQRRLKRSTYISFAGPLEYYIKHVYCEDPEKFETEIENLQNLRNSATSNEISLKQVGTLLRYYCQLCDLQKKFIFDEDNMASGVFSFLSDVVVPSLVLPPCDLSADMINCFKTLMLAQAQECFVTKGIADKTKFGIMVKITNKAAELFDNAYSLGNTSNGSNILGSNFLLNLQIKSKSMAANAQYFRACECLETSKFGEEIARLQIAEEILKGAIEISKKAHPNIANEVKSIAANVSKNLSRAKKDNELIYHDPVPKGDTLSGLGKVDLAKATPFSDGPDLEKTHLNNKLFTSLIPINIQQSLGMYNSSRDEVVRSLIARVEEQSNQIQAQLNSMGLPGSVEALDQPQGIPKSVIEKSAMIKSLGGAENIKEQLKMLEDLRNVNSQILTETKAILAKEQKEDEEARSKFPEKFTRLTSLELQKNMLVNHERFSKTLNDATAADSIVRGKFESIIGAIEILSGDEQHLKQSVPNTTTQTLGKEAIDVVNAMKLILQDLGKSRGTMEKLVKELKDLAKGDDITAFLVAASATQEPCEPIFERELKKYKTFEESTGREIEYQNDLMQKIVRANDAFKNAIMSNAATKERESVLQNLDNASTAFKTLLAHFDEGIKFYTEFQSRLEKGKRDATDFCEARSLELKEILSDIQAKATASAAEAASLNYIANSGYLSGSSSAGSNSGVQPSAPNPTTNPLSPPQYSQNPNPNTNPSNNPISNYYSGPQVMAGTGTNFLHQNQNPTPANYYSNPYPSNNINGNFNNTTAANAAASHNSYQQQQQQPTMPYHPQHQYQGYYNYPPPNNAPGPFYYQQGYGSQPHPNGNPGIWNPNMPVQFNNNNNPQSHGYNQQQQQQQQQNPFGSNNNQNNSNPGNNGNRQ